VPPHVLAHRQQVTGRREQPGRVQPAGPVEHPLRGPQGTGQRGQDLRRDPRGIAGQVIASRDGQLGDARLPADAAGARGQEVPALPGADGHPRRQRHVRDVAEVLLLAVVIVPAPLARADPQLPQVGRAAYDALADQEPGHQVQVVARRPHGQGQRLAADPDAERLLGGQQVSAGHGGGRRAAVQRYPQHPAPGRPSGHSVASGLLAGPVLGPTPP
jgi:hypothetical protein